MLVMMIDNNADNDRMMTICKNEPTCHMLTNLVPWNETVELDEGYRRQGSLVEVQVLFDCFLRNMEQLAYFKEN